MPKQGRRHGTRTCYQGGCRRPECIKAQRTYAREWASLDRRVKRRPGLCEVDPSKAAQHIKGLMAAGMGYRTIAKACGMHYRQLWDIVNGGRPRGIREDTERRILAVTFDPETVPTVGTARRVQAMCVLGHTMAEIAALAGLDQRTLTAIMRQTVVLRGTAEAITTAYQVLSMRIGTSEISRRRAVAKGWAPPLSWDDETIDDPHAEPLGIPVARATHLRAYGLSLDDWFFLVRAGEEPERAAERCGVKLTAVERAALRHGRGAEYTAALHTARGRQAA